MSSRKPYLVLGLFLVVFALGAFVRLYRLDSIPSGLHGDEASAGIFAQRVLREGWVGPYASVALGQPAGTVYVMALIFKVAGPSIFAVRLAPALLGIAAVALMFLLARRLFGNRAGLLAAALLALSYWHLHFSRIGHPIASLPFVEVASLYFLFRGLASGRVWPLVVGGALLGLSVYTYHSFVFFLGAVALVAAYKFFKEWRRWRHYLLRFWLFFAMALVVALPFISFIAQRGIPERFRTTSVFRDAQYQKLDTLGEKADFFLDKTARVVKSLLQGGKIDGVDALGGRGLLDPLTASLFLGGMALALWRIRDERYLLLLAGVSFGLLGSILSSEIEGQYRRIIGSLPFIILAAASFGEGLARALERLLPRFKRAVPGLLLAASLVFVGYWNLGYYFRVLTPSPATRWVFVADLTDAARYLQTLEPDTYVYFYSGRWSWNYETRRFLLPDMEGADRSREFGGFDLERDQGGRVVYLLLPPYEDLLPTLAARYPGGQSWERREADGRVVFRAYSLGP